MFETYRNLYYEGGASSVYMWDTEEEGAGGGFACAILMKKLGEKSKRNPVAGSWDSLHVCEVEERGRNAHYRITSTVMLMLATSTPATGNVDLSGSLTRQTEQEFPFSKDQPHISNIGRLVEEMENRLRNSLEQIYFGKTKDVLGDIRFLGGVAEYNRRKELSEDMREQMAG